MLIHNKKAEKKTVDEKELDCLCYFRGQLFHLFLTPLLFNSEHELKMYYLEFSLCFYGGKRGICIYIIYIHIY